jgi:small subunit ribosomal protein S16
LYNPLTNPPTAKVNVDKVRYWLSVGAQPTDAVKRILGWTGVVEATPTSSSGEPVEAEAQG